MTTLVLEEVRQNLVQLVLDQLRTKTVGWVGERIPISLDPDAIAAFRNDYDLLDAVTDAIRAEMPLIRCKFELEAGAGEGETEKTFFYYTGS